jgi:membrane carboxypeptidase/penicillin-binding protein
MVRPKVWKWVRRLLVLAVAVMLATVAAGAGLYFYYARDLPDVTTLHTWRPPQGTKVYCKGGVLCAEFY